MLEYWKGADACAAIKNVAAQRSKRHRDPNYARSRAVEGVIAAHAMGTTGP